MNETELYEVVAEEIESNDLNKGLWMKAFANSDGDSQKQKALYIKYRVQNLNDKVTQLRKKEKMKKRKKDELKFINFMTKAIIGVMGLLFLYGILLTV